MNRSGLALAAAMAIAGAAGAASGQPANAQREWVRVNGDERVTAYVDRQSIRRTGDLVRFDGRIVYVEPDQQGVKELLHSGEISCSRRDYRIIGFDAIDASGRVIESHVSDDPASAINDSSPNATLHSEYCR